MLNALYAIARPSVRQWRSDSGCHPCGIAVVSPMESYIAGLELSGVGGLNPPVHVYRRSFLSENRP